MNQPEVIDVTWLKIRYLMVLAVIGLISLGGYYLLETVIISQQSAAVEINISGRQRMLSLKITLLRNRIDNIKSEADRYTLVAELKGAVELMRQSHLVLSKGSTELKISPPSSNELKGLYFGPSGIDVKVREFLKFADEHIKHLNDSTTDPQDWERLYNDASHILHDLNEIVEQYEAESKTKIDILQHGQTVFLISILIILVGSGLLVFKPMVARISSQISEIERRRKDSIRGQELLDTTTDHISQGLSVFDDDLRLVVANTKFGTLLSLPKELTAIGTKYEDIIRFNAERGDYGSGNVEEQVASRVTLAKNTEPHHFERTRPNGSTLLIVGNPMPGGGFVTTYSDITKRKNAERLLKNAKLEADASNKAKSEFLAIMSHELRTPLNAINGFSEMMQMEVLGSLGDPKYTEYANDIHGAGEHLIEVINDVLDISKIEAGAQELSISELEITEEIDRTLKLVLGRAVTHNITVSTNIPDKFPRLMADRLRLKQMLLNLLTNAIKFTPEEGKVSVVALLSEGNGVVLQVRDTGIGISKENLSKVFDPFGQVDDPMVRNQEGTGLGVPLTKSLMELHGGTLTIESEEGSGTVASLIFPPERTIES